MENKIRHIKDLRGKSWWDIYPMLPGQVNISITRPKEVRAFHKHLTKENNIFIAKGEYMVVLLDKDMPRATLRAKQVFLSQGDFLCIEPDQWYGFQNIGLEDSIMVYYETKKSGPTMEDDLSLAKEEYRGWL